MVSLVLVSALAISCGHGQPSLAQGEQAVRPYAEVYGRLLEFRKVNGESRSVAGQKHYVLHFRVATEMEPGWEWVRDPFKGPGIYRAFAPDLPNFLGMPSRTSIPSGSTYVGRGEVVFRHSENGWIVDDVDVRQQGYCNPGPTPSECFVSTFGS